MPDRFTETEKKALRDLLVATHGGDAAEIEEAIQAVRRLDSAECKSLAFAFCVATDDLRAVVSGHTSR